MVDGSKMFDRRVQAGNNRVSPVARVISCRVPECVSHCQLAAALIEWSRDMGTSSASISFPESAPALLRSASTLRVCFVPKIDIVRRIRRRAVRTSKNVRSVESGTRPSRNSRTRSDEKFRRGTLQTGRSGFGNRQVCREYPSRVDQPLVIPPPSPHRTCPSSARAGNHRRCIKRAILLAVFIALSTRSTNPMERHDPSIDRRHCRVPSISILDEFYAAHANRSKKNFQKQPVTFVSRTHVPRNACEHARKGLPSSARTKMSTEELDVNEEPRLTKYNPR